MWYEMACVASCDIWRGEADSWCFTAFLLDATPGREARDLAGFD